MTIEPCNRLGLPYSEMVSFQTKVFKAANKKNVDAEITRAQWAGWNIKLTFPCGCKSRKYFGTAAELLSQTKRDIKNHLCK